jgi:hypothetical protein
VREQHHGVAAEQAGRALDGVRGAEGGVQVLGIEVRAWSPSPAAGLLELLQHVGRFVQKADAGGGDDLGVVVG